MGMPAWRYDEADDFLEDWADDGFSEDLGDEFFRRFGQRVRALAQRAARGLRRLGAIGALIWPRQPDESRMRRRPELPPIIAPPPPRPTVLPPDVPRPRPARPGSNGVPPRPWDPSLFPPSPRRRRNGNLNFDAFDANGLMQHLGHAAAAADSEDEAEAFVGAMIPLAARLMPRAAPALLRNAPALIRTAAAAARALRESRRTRPLVQVLPTILQRTAASLARQSAGGRIVTPGRAARTMAAHTTGLLQQPRRSAQTLRRAIGIDRRYHLQ